MSSGEKIINIHNFIIGLIFGFVNRIVLKNTLRQFFRFAVHDFPGFLDVEMVIFE